MGGRSARLRCHVLIISIEAFCYQLVFRFANFINVFFVFCFCNCSCDLGKRFFAKFDKLAESLNVRDDVKLAHIDCEADSEFCDSNGVKGRDFGSFALFKMELLT